MVEPVIVVGAGISGIACARTLTAAGAPVRVVDRGHRPGGRMASRRHDGRPVDIGASYFTASDPQFVRVVTDWRARGLAYQWTDTLTVLDKGHNPRRTTGPIRWAARSGQRALVEDLASGLAVERGTVTVVDHDGNHPTVDGRRASAVVLAMPDPQAIRLLGPRRHEKDSLTAVFEPVLALSAGWHQRRWDTDLDGAFVNGDDHLDWVADDGRRRGDDAPVLVAHSTTGFAAQHLESPEETAPLLLSALRRILAIDIEPAWTRVHRWTFARPAAPRDEPFMLSEQAIGACGDGWAAKPRVEAAYLSGVRLGEALVERLGLRSS